MNDYQRFQQIIEFLEKLPKKFWGTINTAGVRSTFLT